MPLANKDLISFFSGHPIDKIVSIGNTTITNSGATTNAPQESFVVSSSVTNPYLKKCFVRAKFSIDGTNYQSTDSHLLYPYTITVPAVPITVALSGLRAAVSVGVSDSTIHFRTANGYHGNVTQVGANYTYTPISQDFHIIYAIFEVE